MVHYPEILKIYLTYIGHLNFSLKPCKCWYYESCGGIMSHCMYVQKIMHIMSNYGKTFAVTQDSISIIINFSKDG